MRRLQISLPEELDEALGAEAARTGRSKAAVVRELVAARVGAVSEPDPLDDLVGALDVDLGAASIDDAVYDR